jgi:hypothetical protein
MNLRRAEMIKSGFTLEEHRDTGAKLGMFRNELVSLNVKIGNAYSQSISEDLDKATKLIDRVRSSMDDLVCEENPELDNADLLDIYYGDLSGTR